uniref:Glycine N-acyltransferase-like protein n=1 Tax=Caenorhabditis tropicalis TaxID=1561998 RepID=A0A1I7UW54_9PELO
MFSKLSAQEIKDHITLFQSNPKLSLFANGAKFEVEGRLPNHPCDFYSLEINGVTYFYVFRHNKIPDECRPILMIGSDQMARNNDVVIGLKHLKLVEPNLRNITMLIATSDLSMQVRKFFISNFDREDYNNPCYHFFIPNSASLPSVETLPPGFSIGSTRLSDAETVNSTWKFGSPASILQMKDKLQRLPTVCIFHEDKPISFEMIGLHGQLNHQYTFPEYRNKGFGGIVEKTIISKCFEYLLN